MPEKKGLKWNLAQLLKVAKAAKGLPSKAPERQRHNYQWIVKALDAGGKTLATASAASPFPPR